MPEATRFGKYTLFERIAVGGMAEVFRAQPVGSDQLLAIKRIHPHHLENSDFVSMLIDEAKISIQLRHPNVVEVIDLGRVDKHYFIAMEYIDGRDLRRVLERVAESGRKLPIPESVSIIARVARGLDYAHGKEDARGQKMEIIHRDISPQNVLVGFDGNVKVIDFGIAKAAGRLMETQVGILKGKYAYMSPEQAAGGTLDHRTDIFSTGIMLYECVVGKHPFRAAHDLETLRNIKNSTMVPPREANPAIPPSVEAVILQALATRKEDRYFTAGAMAADLEAALDEIRPGYSDANLSEFAQGLFADEIAGGPSPHEAPKPVVTATGPGRAARLNPPPPKTSPPRPRNDTRTASAPARAAYVPAGGGAAAVPRVAVSGGESPVAKLATDFRNFYQRAMDGRLTQADSVLLVGISVLVFALALFLLLYEPAPAGRASGNVSIATPTATAAGTLPSLMDLTIDSSPRDADVFVAGKLRGKTPVTVPSLASGVPVDVRVMKTGYAPWTGQGVPGQTKVFASLRSVPTGFVNVVSRPPKAEIIVNDVVVGHTPMRVELATGQQQVRVRDPASGAEGSQTVTIKTGADAVVTFQLQ